MQELISVIIPCHNGTNYLAEAIAGIYAQGLPVEIIVVDDKSTDDTAALAERMHCRVIRHETMRGQVAGKNTGLRATRGKYVLFHDHDDVMNGGALSALHQELCANKNVDLIMAKVRDFISPELEGEDVACVQIKEEPYYGLFTGAVLMRRKLFDVVGYFDEQLNTGEIIDLMGKIEKLGPGKYKKIDMVATNRRVHRTNYGRTHTVKEYKDYLTVLRAKLRV